MGSKHLSDFPRAQVNVFDFLATKQRRQAWFTSTNGICFKIMGELVGGLISGLQNDSQWLEVSPSTNFPGAMTWCFWHCFFFYLHVLYTCKLTKSLIFSKLLLLVKHCFVCPKTFPYFSLSPYNSIIFKISKKNDLGCRLIQGHLLDFQMNVHLCSLK